jgi:uncharacterized membrane protein YdjX (TVP38/TMEM64 family)
MNEKKRAVALRWARPAATVLMLALLAAAYLFSGAFRGGVNEGLAALVSGDAGALRDYILQFGAWAPLVSAGLMVLQALLAFVPSFLLGFANGLAFGAFWGGVLSLTSAMLAAAICFYLARALGRTPIEALVGRDSLGRADRFFERYGAYAILTARLIPVVSFDAVSYAAGLTKMGFWRFLGATTIGMAPATFLYSYLGQSAPGYLSLLLAVFGVFVAAALGVALFRRRRRGKKPLY